MKATSIVILILYYWLGCCYSFRDIYKKSKGPIRRNWYDHNRVGTKRVRSTVSSKLHFSQTPEDQIIVSAGESIKLTCEVISKPYATIYWTKDGVRIPQGVNSNLVEGQRYENEVNQRRRPSLLQSSQISNLFIDCFTPKKAGTYNCEAEVDSLSISHSTEVASACPVTTQNAYGADIIFRLINHVICSGILPANKQCNTNEFAARIYSYTTYRVENSGSAVQLSCRANGTPAPNITWYNYNKKIKPGTRGYKFLSNGDMVVQSWRLLDHFFLFKCSAENKFGSDSVSISLYLVERGK